ncbi:5-oxoprolinase subunit PxpB [Bordetella sp. 15P40C-2]|uniref:5-oxoprolinase subunit PxpB n=1 Tax=Bordetella sp. 15P40C-2 TaxID=2572246 RepID=UPI00132BA1F4|nr:5-oxoprolinase subunit PxpB [Bordetella sp. 15P40C-2]MVW72334.1 5-oxoprolinase subunit PxpB [Bordetella sp. 15P40C-2]
MTHAFNIEPVCSRQGETAILCELGTLPGPTDLELQRRVWGMAAALSSHDDVLEVVPGMNNLLVIYREPQRDFAACEARIREVWKSADTHRDNGREIVVPVVYGGPEGMDLNYVAEHCGLTREDYIGLHAESTYVVYALGSQPGFAYLGGLDPRLAVPRRDTPRPRVNAGSVIIGGAQAGVLSRTSPSGWHIIGTTALNCFDHTRATPALFAPGDRVRFEVQAVRA